jgi:hypothetical protein
LIEITIPVQRSASPRFTHSALIRNATESVSGMRATAASPGGGKPWSVCADHLDARDGRHFAGPASGKA